MHVKRSGLIILVAVAKGFWQEVIGFPNGCQYSELYHMEFLNAKWWWHVLFTNFKQLLHEAY